MDWDELLGSYQNRTNIKSKNMFPWQSILSGGFGVLGTILQNVFNTRQIEATNKANRELVDVQNQFQREESEKAFQRSLPVQQVNNLRNAGMSQAGAINTLNGGGSYTPAPVNVAQDQAPQVDFSHAINAIQAAASLQEQKRQFNLQHAEQKRQFDLTHQETKRMNDDALLTSASQRKLNDVEINGKSLQNQLLGYEAAVEKDLFDSGQTLTTRSAQRMAEHAQAVLDAFKNQKVHEVMSTLTNEELTNLFKLQGYMNLLSSVITYDVPAKAKEYFNKAKDLIQGIVLPKGAKK